MAETLADVKIPGHRIVRELGRGGMARVYLAVQKSMDREVALKVMLPSLIDTDPSFGKRFLREARIVAKLSHPHIIAVYDVGVAGAYHYFTMEYHTGGDLRARIREGMAPRQAFTVARQIAAALAFAHTKGYVHRDVKPENVIFRHDGTAVLTDFGIARGDEVQTRMTAIGSVIGTPHYMSPEQAQGGEVDARADLYSLGVMLYEMLTGNVPYAGGSALAIGIKHLKEPVPPLPPTLSAYQPLLNKLLAKKPEERFQRGEEIVAALDALASGVSPALSNAPTVIAGATGGAQRTLVTGTRASGRRHLIIAIAVALPLLGVGAYFLLRGPAPPVITERTSQATDSETAAANKLELLLAEADAAMRAGRYLEPEGESAAHRYRQALALEPGNARATRGLQDIASHTLAQSRQAQETGDFARAESLLKQAEQADATHASLAPQRQALSEARAKAAAPATPPKKVAQPKPAPRPEPQPPAPAAPAPVPVASVDTAKAREQEAREQRLNSLLARQQELLSPAGLTDTRLGLAEELHAEASRLAPDDARVKAAPAQIAEAYLRLATRKTEEKEYKEADALVRKGLGHSPNHRQLLALQKDIAERQKSRRQTFGTF
jgi:hypothetical protein